MTTSTGADTTALSFDERISRLAEVAVRIGLGLQNGQELVMTAPLEAGASRPCDHHRGLQGRRVPGDYFLFRRRCDLGALRPRT